MQDSNFLFIYSSLRHGFNSPAFHYISQYFNFVSNGYVNGKLVDLGEYPVGVSAVNEYKIIGELYELKQLAQKDWAFAQLDDYEGVLVEATEVPLFIKSQTIVHLPNNAEVLSWIYWYNGDTSNCPIIATGDVFDYKKNIQ